MKLLSALRNLRITTEPTCVQHRSYIDELQKDLHDVRNEFMAERVRRESADRRYSDLCKERDRLNSLKLQYSMELERATAAIETQAATIDVQSGAMKHLEDELAATRSRCDGLQNDLNVAGNASLSAIEKLMAAGAESETRREMLREQLVEAAAMLEESNARNAVLERQLREMGATDEQLALLHAPSVDAVAGGEIPNLQDEIVGESKQMGAVYRLVGLFFEGRHFWLFSLGDQRIKAPIHDKDFLERMHRHEVAFAAGDVIRCDVAITTYRSQAGDVYAEYVIEKVHAVIPPDQQVPLIETEVASV